MTILKSIGAVFAGFVVVAGLGQLSGIAGVVFGWNLSAHWYPIMIAITAIPAVVLGGWLRTKTIWK